MRKGKLVLLFLAVIGLLGMLAACGEDAPAPTATSASVAPAATPTYTPIPTATPTPEGERPEYGGWLYTGRSNRTAVDAYSTNTGTSYLWADYEALLGYAQPYDPSVGPVIIPKLATEWSVDKETGAKWTFTLREGVKWHDGEAFDADDVVATFNRALEPGLPVARRSLVLKEMIVGVTKIDSHTVVIDTGEANASFISVIANNHSSIMPEHLITGDPSAADVEDKWVFLHPDTTGTLSIGTGHFKMIAWDPEGCVSYARNEDYWAVDEFGNQLPYLDGWHNCEPLDDSREFAKFVTRDYQTSDFTGLGLDEAQDLCSKTVEPETCYTAQHGHGWFSIFLNHTIEPFNDSRVVQAARYSLDPKDAMEFQFGEGTGEGAGTWIDRDSFAAATLSVGELEVLMPWMDDTRRGEMDQRAKDLLASAGYPNGLELSQPWSASCSRLFRNFYTPLVDSFNKNGIQGFQECREGIIAREEQLAGRWSVYIYAAGITFMDPLNSFNLSGASWAGTVGRGPWAWEGVETVDDMYYKSIAVVDPDERNEVYKDMERFLADDTLTQFPVGHNKMTVPINGCVRNYYPGPGMYHGMQHRNTWLEEECRNPAP